MPYPRAHLALLLLVPLTLLAFWRSYFSVATAAPLAFHVHGVTAAFWILLLIVQTWLIHHRPLGMHRLTGRFSYVLLPLFLVGGLMVLQTMAQHTAEGRPFMALYGARLGAFDVVTVLAFVGLYISALRNRHHVELHARYMLATPILLLAPVFSRILPNYVPALAIRGVEDFALFSLNLHLANGLAALVALVLFATAPRHGRPFLIVVAIAGLKSALFQWLGPTAWWRSSFAALADVPVTVLATGGLVAGAALVWWALAAPRPGPVAAGHSSA